MKTSDGDEVWNKVVALVERFPTVCRKPLVRKKIGSIFWLLVVGSQIVNLTIGPSFGHNLCFKCPNGWCEPILDIYVTRAFQWYKKLLKALSFDPCNRLLKIRESTWTPSPKVGVVLGVWRFIPSHTFALPGACDMTPGFFSWLATL